ncbi:MAG: lysophospholipid acyltransferase family protein [Vampirovibrionales bacterium]|nr:lysophospholipid acyltransferase family protein [Vampirovibrionales bacterium]
MPLLLPKYNTLAAEDLGVFPRFINNLTSILIRQYLKAFQGGMGVSGQSNLPSRPCGHILVANHTSNWDPPLVSSAVWPHPVSYMAKAELFTNPLISWYFRKTGAFLVNRQKLETATIRSAKTVLSQPGWFLGMFPEGTRAKTDLPEGVQPFKRGVSFIARLTKADVVPIGIVRRKPDPITGKLKRPAAWVQIGAPIITNGMDNEDEIQQAVFDAIRLCVAEARKNLGMAPE